MTSIISALGGFFISSRKYQRKKYPPCSAVGPTKISLPDKDGSCPVDAPDYNFVFLSPMSAIPVGVNIYSNVQTEYSNVILDKNVVQGFSYSSDKSYFNMLPTNAPQTFNGTQYFLELPSNVPLNMCPQCFSKTGTGSSFASIISLPLSYYNHNLATKMWIIPGYATSDENVLNTPINTQQLTQPGLATVLYAICLDDFHLFIELAGGRGGKYPQMTNSSTPVDISPFLPGNPGIVCGTYGVKKNDVLKIHLGSPGHSNDNVVIPFGGQGQGGAGTLYGGAFGGGPSYITHYPYAKYGHHSFPGGSPISQYEAVLDAAFANDPNALIVCVAAGGGGSSRHASGGHGGGSNENLKFGQSMNSKVMGSVGGQSFSPGLAPQLILQGTNDLSGGGGANRVGGASKVTNATGDCGGRKLLPFVDNGGGSVITDVGSGGGGGGGGIFGGGSGAYNDLAKPNNVHGAGGGGSSYPGLLRFATPDNASLNVYRKNAMTSNYGYIVIGISTT